ncbi:MAG: MATE family efflux transporter [Faecalibacterium sp.]
MYFIAAACVVNIGLDFFFMGALRLGPAGAALGTTLSQAVSVLLALCVILKRKSIRLSKSDFCPRKATMKDILSIGLPVAAQDGFIQVSFMLITIMANQRGLTDAAAVGIVEKIISFLFLVPSSMLSTVSALGAQNIGAGKYDRTDDILRYAIAIGVGFGAVMALLMQFIAPSVVRPFTSDEAVVLAGAAYIRSYIFDCLFAGIQFSFSGYFCAWGRSGLSFLHNTLSILLVRVPGAWLACFLAQLRSWMKRQNKPRKGVESTPKRGENMYQ